jgi:hypothetical protein
MVMGVVWVMMGNPPLEWQRHHIILTHKEFMNLPLRRARGRNFLRQLFS